MVLRKEIAQRARVEDAMRRAHAAETKAQVAAERERAEKALREGEERLRYALETSHTGAWDLDLIDHSAYRSLEHDRIFGYPELLPKWTYDMFLEHVLPEDRAEVDTKFRQATDTQTDWNFECRIRRLDGEIRWIRAAGCHRTDSTGGMRRMAGIVLDITEAKKSAEALRKSHDELEARVQERTAALRESQQRFTSMLEGVRDYSIVFLDTDGRVASWNIGAERIKGYQSAEIIGQPLSKFYLPADIARGKPDNELKVATAEGRFEDEDWRVRKDGSCFWANVILTALRDSQGKINGFVKITRDLTERKRAEDKMKRQAEELQISNRELEYFAYVASHDLQEPLRTVASFSQLLARRYQGKLDTDADEFIAFIVDGATRMQTLINDLLSFSRIGTRGNPFTMVNCEQILKTVRENLSASIAERGAIITHDPLPALVADATQLTQLFQNLTGNAIKFTRPEVTPRIHISAARQEDAWRLSVRDNGIGIDPQFFDRIFIIFQRLHGRNEYPGTGIGLAICKKIVERHGGRIEVESAPGKGSAFHFTIPDDKRNYD